MIIIPAKPAHIDQWAQMRCALWPDASAADHAVDAAAQFLTGKPDAIAFVALDQTSCPVGFAEAALRRDYVEGCESSPVAFLEGIYVMPGRRGQGLGRLLTMAVSDWAKSTGCTEFASNALIDNNASHAFHIALGFVETERVVYFRKEL